MTEKASSPSDAPVDSPEVAAAIERRKKTLDRQTVMAIVGLFAVALFLNFDAKDHDKTVAGMLAILPWIVGLSIGIFLLNRWTLVIQTKLLRRDASQAGGR